ncbi:MAG: biotin--[acetyl-CoA-carboxylase] ligase [Candidatus Omnitrophica bacterium]|nr:biotin--[acetyl-CoA-carboxylase] ligase [Candidatus Omnitrophota bacterium]MBU1047641.1 biotin--[acetyl-CoA-carboxylase] ligase [Candidatus Omnitrophota bacterium]MBU1766917.1 biotin--[acetyl-CoA-carboxylase] ligase [Candidatus Omnitrophota bacterium]MBU1888629.1 biotin--[acetyl-CoA-carboxylase] ligase [Candidatus Omnitrophota bacterium]
MELLLPNFEDTLKTKIIGHPLYIYTQLDSTQTTAKILAENGAKEGATILAYSQKKGTGRNGKKWFSPEGGVWFTVILRPSFSLEQTNIINVIFTTACAEVLHSFKISKPTIKWPNDILINGKKICGILTQTKSGNDIEYALVGVGINLNAGIKDFPKELNNTATSLGNETGKRIKLDEFLTLLLEKIEKYYLMLKNGKSKTIQAEWEKFSLIGT